MLILDAARTRAVLGTIGTAGELRGVLEGLGITHYLNMHRQPRPIADWNPYGFGPGGANYREQDYKPGRAGYWQGRIIRDITTGELGVVDYVDPEKDKHLSAIRTGFVLGVWSFTPPVICWMPKTKEPA